MLGAVIHSSENPDDKVATAPCCFWEAGAIRLVLPAFDYSLMTRPTLFKNLTILIPQLQNPLNPFRVQKRPRRIDLRDWEGWRSLISNQEPMPGYFFEASMNCSKLNIDQAY
jgi:hypothetical protein